MRFELLTPAPDQLGALVADLSSWQRDGLPIQLHPGDLGWQWRFGSITLAQALRVWIADDTTMAIGFFDEASLIRMAIAPSADHDEEFAQALVCDLEDPARGIPAAHKLIVEARFGTALRSLLHSHGWVDDDPWTPLVRDLSDPVDASGLRVEIVGPERVADRVAVQRAAFDRSTFTAALWEDMSQSSAYQQACCLVGYDGQDNVVAAVTLWSAGPGRPGLLEPMGVQRDHRTHGYGTAISVAAAAALRNMGASSALVATPSSNERAVATYASAGFRRMPEVTDFVTFVEVQGSSERSLIAMSMSARLAPLDVESTTRLVAGASSSPPQARAKRQNGKGLLPKGARRRGGPCCRVPAR